MSNTKDPWEIFDDYKKTHGITIRTNEYGAIATLWGEDKEANAQLIVAAVNACTKVNPDNPQAAAEALPDIYEALGECLLLIEDMMPGVAGIALQNYQRLNEAPINARKALAKARKK